MERFVFNIAVTIAIITAVVIGFGGNIHIDMGDAFGADPVIRAVAEHPAPQTLHGDSVEIRHTSARIIVTPEDRQDVMVEIVNPGHAPTPTVRTNDGAVVIDGHLRGRVSDCGSDSMRLSGYGTLSADQLPQITIHMPRAVKIDVGGGNFTQIGAAELVEADLSGCGSTTIADVSGPLKLDVSGSGELTAGAAQSLDLDLSGSGHAQIGVIAQDATLDISGSGVTRIASVTGDLKSDISGSGGVTVDAGHLANAEVNVSGSSSTHLAGPVDHLSVDIGGSGVVEVATGAMTEANLDVGGSGEVRLAGPVQHLTADLAGSGNVVVAGDVHDLDAQIAGSGTVHARSVTGAMNKQIMGPGEVIIGR